MSRHIIVTANANFRFHVCSFASKIERSEGDWGRKLRPDLWQFSPPPL